MRQRTNTVHVFRSPLKQKLVVVFARRNEVVKHERVYYNPTISSRRRLERWLFAHRDDVVINLTLSEPWVIWTTMGRARSGAR